MKLCSSCKTAKPLDDFYKHARSSDGKQSRCKVCSAEGVKRYRRTYTERQKLLKRLSPYNITIKQYRKMMKRQGGRCALCRQPPAEGKSLHIDHDHSCCSGRRSCGRCVRGLLCAHCNHALGLLNDDPKVIARLARYIAEGRSA